MDDPLAVRSVQRGSHLHRDLHRLIGSHRSLLDAIGQRRPLDQLHHQIVGPDVVERADVRMVERGDGARFALEAIGKSLGGHLEGDIAPQP